MEFSPEIIRKVAKLAKIRLTDSEIAIFNDQFAAISTIIEKLRQVDTKNITPINNPSQATLLLREDVVTEKDQVNVILSNAPKHAFNCFMVPKVIE